MKNHGISLTLAAAALTALCGCQRPDLSEFYDTAAATAPKDTAGGGTGISIKVNDEWGK